ncbi:hypothetical protein OZN62_07960 [Aurantiacibacter sp. MUD11]|uniref:hypothetical protein n=1 Tax=Aurantiacibacter sp. MUD11 TaxID=3003265 RepID=UPI0022AA5EF3|nr:hypothetical protein [Aurantiacibacter sp. MUD11]WAT16880.1 hypothetical protein OZN62_07960 [Aurantiacibacter sp. MUD11]
MRNLVCALCIVLAACSSEETEPVVETTDFVTANGTSAGIYEVSAEDGTTSIVTIYADGTYSQVTPDGTQAAAGELSVVDGKTCFRARVAGSQPLCYTETPPDADGAYTATPEGGEPLTVRPYDPSATTEG